MSRTIVPLVALGSLALLIAALPSTLLAASLAHGEHPAHQQLPSAAAPRVDQTAEGWRRLSSANGVLAVDGPDEQTAALVLDIDRDGLNDFVIAGRGGPPAIVWYQRGATGWTRHIVEAGALPIEAGGTFGDVDRDGDLDLIFGGDYSNDDIAWWENPYPSYAPGTAWRRHMIKDRGLPMHHDMLFGDFDSDGADELVFWNQGSSRLWMAEVPDDPQAGQIWTRYEIFYNREIAEGLAKADIDGDGKLDLVAGGRWLRYAGNGRFISQVIDTAQRYSRAAVGQLKPGGRPEVVFVAGDEVGRLKWYEWTGSYWEGRDLLDESVDHGHSLEVADINADGHLDIFCAEMRLNGGNEDAKSWIFYGDGRGNFRTTLLSEGYDNHESRVADLDGDGDLDVLGKPYNHNTPGVEIWLNELSESSEKLSLTAWERHVVDADRPGQAVFITATDLDGDGRQDIATGGVWYRNGGLAAGPWERRAIGAPLANMAAVFDVDGDSSPDVLGTQGDGANANAAFVWAQNDGAGSFTVRNNITQGTGDFLQGVAVGRFQANGPVEVALSWHQSDRGVQLLALPAAPATETWPWRVGSTTSQDEGLSAGDIDRDGDLDLLLGTKWLRNNDGSWTPFTLNSTAGLPDRNRLADINGDGRLDAVVGFEAISAPGKLAWYEQGANPTASWTERPIATLIGPMSLDVADMDGDGDADVVVGEHNMANPARARLLLFENRDGRGGAWTEHLVHTGDEHHDGAQVVDLDGDGDKDIVSIGWGHRRVLLYENKAVEPGSPEPEPEPGKGPDPQRVFLPLTVAP